MKKKIQKKKKKLQSFIFIVVMKKDIYTETPRTGKIESIGKNFHIEADKKLKV